MSADQVKAAGGYQSISVPMILYRSSEDLRFAITTPFFSTYKCLFTLTFYWKRRIFT